MRTIDEMQDQAEEIIKQATDRESTKVPTQLEIQMAGNVLRLITCLKFASDHIAHLFKDEWDQYLKSNQLQ